MTELKVQAEAQAYVVHVGHQTLTQLGPLLRGLSLHGKIALVSDDHVLALWRDPVVKALTVDGQPPRVLSVHPGESSKSLAHADALYSELVRGGFERSDMLVALGGGVVGDLAGFVAATYHRGMQLVHVPTTLLAQVDSSIGGKVAVDHVLGKNLIGSFYPPRLVFTDTAFLATLPSRERWSGLAEVVKVGLIADVGLLTDLEQALEAAGNGTLAPDRATNLVSRAAAIKVRVVSEDEKEQGVRMHLNFGHTLGHALEAATGFGPLTHGEAIVLGMRAALWLSEKMGSLSATETQRALALLARFPKPPSGVPRVTADTLVEMTARDKKVRGGTVRFVLLKGLGHAFVETSIARDLLREAAERMVAEL